MAGARRSFKTGGIGSIPEVRAGYWWDPTVATGHGTASFLMYEMNGNATHNLVAPSASAAPTSGTLNGQAILSFANGVPDQNVRTGTTVTRGFTGAQMFWGWHNITGSGGNITLCQRRGANTIFAVSFGATRVDVLFNDGAVQEARFPLITYASGPFFFECVFDPSQAATNRIQFWVDRVQSTPTLAPSVGTTVADTAELINIGSSVADGSGINYSTDFSVGTVGITNGVPSATDRDRMMNFRRLK